MLGPTFSPQIARRTARMAAAGFGVVAAFHLLLTLGAPWGRATLGGSIDGTLPPELRVAWLIPGLAIAVVANVQASANGLGVGPFLIFATDRVSGSRFRLSRPFRSSTFPMVRKRTADRKIGTGRSWPDR